MAKINEEVIVIKLSRLVRDNEDTAQSATSPEIIAAIEQVTQELVGSSVIVEVESV